MKDDAYRSGVAILERPDEHRYVLTFGGPRLNRAIGPVSITREAWGAADVRWMVVHTAMHLPHNELPEGVRLDETRGRLSRDGTELSVVEAAELLANIHPSVRLSLNSHQVPNLTVLQDKLIHVILHVLFTRTRATAVVIEGQSITIYNTRMASSPLMRCINEGIEVHTSAIRVTLAEDVPANSAVS